jgi:hypothetical protein
LAVSVETVRISVMRRGKSVEPKPTRRLSAGDRDTPTAYTDIHRLFQRGELTAICKAAMAQHGSINTWALVTHILAAKGLDSGDRVLANRLASV